MSSCRRLAPWAVSCFTVLVVVGLPDAAWAHNKLRGSAPADRARLTAAPARVELEFAERLDPAYTTVAVTDDATKDTVSTGEAQVSGTRVYQPLPTSLSGGDYTVAYRVVSVDGHPVKGTVRFTITPSRGVTSPPSAPAAAASTAAVAAVAGDAAPRRGTLLLVTGVAAVFVGGLVVWWTRRRRHRA